MAEQIEKRKRILSGIQPTGTPTLGNYIGAVRNWALLQSDYDCLYMVADLHALTVRQTPANLRRQTREMAALLLAVGIDPEQHVLFVQSHVPAHCELSWVLACNTQFGELSRMTQFKDKSAKHPDNVNGGLFTYTVLMAADILLFHADYVPVGKDQKQHLEVTRDLAMAFNRRFGDILTIPDAIIQPDVAVIPGLDGQKMSKSYNNTIELFGEGKAIRSKFMKIKTDSTPVEDPKNPDTCNVFLLYRLMATPEETEALRQQYLAGGMGYGVAKQLLFEKYTDYFAEARARRAELMANPAKVEEILQEGARKARAVAEESMLKIRAAVGL